MMMQEFMRGYNLMCWLKPNVVTSCRDEEEAMAAVSRVCELVQAGETLRDFPIGADAAAKKKHTQPGEHDIVGLEQRSMIGIVVSLLLLVFEQYVEGMWPLQSACYWKGNSIIGGWGAHLLRFSLQRAQQEAGSWSGTHSQRHIG